MIKTRLVNSLIVILLASCLMMLVGCESEDAGLSPKTTAPDATLMPTLEVEGTATITSVDLFHGIYIDIPSQKLTAGEDGIISIMANFETEKIRGAEIKFTFDPKILKVNDVTPGVLMGPNALVAIEEIDNDEGMLHYAVACKGTNPVLSESGSIMMIYFQVTEQNQKDLCNLSFKEINLSNDQFEPITGFEARNAVIEIETSGT